MREHHYPSKGVNLTTAESTGELTWVVQLSICRWQVLEIEKATWWEVGARQWGGGKLSSVL